MSEVDATVWNGSSVVYTVIGVLVAVAGTFGLLLGAVILPERVDGPLPKAVLGPITFEITPVSMAIYGVVMIGTSLLVGLLLVRLVSRRYVGED